MSVKFKTIARKKPGDATAPEKYYPSLKRAGKTTLRELAQKGALISTFSNIDMMAAAEVLLTLIPKELAAGNAVDLGDFGVFSLKVTTTGEDAPDKVSAKNITKTTVSFRAGKVIKHELGAVAYEKDG